MSYEHALRKKMVYFVKKGHTVKEGIKMAMDDPVTKERFFTTPLCLEAVSGKRPAPAEWSHSDDTPANQAPYEKGSKGSGKKGKERARPRKAVERIRGAAAQRALGR